MERPARRRVPSYALLGVLGAALLVALPGTDKRPVCPDGVLRLPGSPEACVHVDAAPPGVDVHAPVATADLRARRGAGPRAYAAAEALGVPGTYASTATSSAVTCDGDGTSGARVQAMYVVEAGRTNRFASLVPSLQLWAAGVDDVLNRSAALTGGSRHVRFVTDPASGSCVARVLNVTVPTGATSSFNATVQAVQALGYTSPARKYLMWTDATVLCGVASMYPDETAGQTNNNNGKYPQYARIDSGCWGLGNGTNQHSVEAHELTHTLGAVQYQAPHTTKAGHCWDEADTMCYADGGTHAMVQVCPAEREYLLDCNSDDYFSTYPTGYLAAAWDSANSQFLIGGGNGTAGGTLGAPTSLGGTMAVNNPAVPGLPTQASVSPELPSGRTLTSVTWKAGRSDCTVTPAADGTQASVTCGAGSATVTTLTATLVDSTGATKAVTSPLTFQATGTRRAVTVGLAVDGQTGTGGVCTGVPSSGVVTVLDQASGVPVKGLSAAYTRQAPGATAPSTAAFKLTGADGTATASLVTSTPTTYAATTAAVGMFSAGTAAGVAVTPARCTAALSATPSTLNPWYGDTVSVRGSLRRTVSSKDDTAVPGAWVQVAVKAPDTVSTTGATVTGRTTLLGSAVTDATGAFTARFRAAPAGRLLVTLPASPGFSAATADLGDMAVRTPSTTMTAAASTTQVGFGQSVTVSGTLRRITDTSSPLPGAMVAIRVMPTAGTVQTLAYTSVRTDGTFRVAVTGRLSGTLSAVYAGAAGQPAASAVAGSLTVSPWTPTLTLAASPTTVALGGYVTLSGTATRTYAGTTEPAGGLRVALLLTPANGGAAQLLGYGYPGTTGAFQVRVYPRASGRVAAVVTGVQGYVDGSSSGVGLSVS